MSKIDRFNGDVKAFASEYQGTERTTFGTTVESDELTQQQTSSYLRGWGIVGSSEDPSLEDFNAAMFTATQYIAYLHQMGVPEWNALQEYPTEGAQVTHSLRSWLRGPDWASGDEPGVADSTRWKSVVLSDDLGTAAFADMATSITDTDESKAQGVGYLGYGLRVPTTGQQVTDFDTLDLSEYGDGAKLWFGSGATGQPDGLSLFGKVELFKFNLSTYLITITFTTSNRTFSRYHSSSGWNDWVEELNSSNAGTAAYVSTGTGSDQVATNGEMGHINGGGTLIDWSSVVFSDLIVNQRLFYNTGTLNMPAEITDVSSTGSLIVFKNANSKYGGFLLMSSNAAPAIIPVVNGVISTAILPYTSNENATSTEINTGTSTDTIVTPSGLAGSEYNHDNRMHISTGNTITTAGLLTIAHGLSETPTSVQFILVCTSAEAGYSVGDQVPVDYNSSYSAVNRINSPTVTSTYTYVRFMNAPSLFSVAGKSTGNIETLTNANWTLTVISRI